MELTSTGRSAASLAGARRPRRLCFLSRFRPVTLCRVEIWLTLSGDTFGFDVLWFVCSFRQQTDQIKLHSDAVSLFACCQSLQTENENFGM